MKIIKYIKKKDGKYEVILDNNKKYILFEDIILKYNLLITKNVNEKEIEILLKDNMFEEAYLKALKYINTRLRSKGEVIKYLRNYDKDIINYVIDKLILNGYLNDNLYITSYVNDAIVLSNKGYNKILNELISLGFEKEVIIKYLNDVDESIWKNKINKYISKKCSCNHKYSINYLKNKLISELSNLGYEKNLINNCINNINYNNDSNIIEKEYNKIYTLLSKKYSSKELEHKIIGKLLSKGFNYDEIKHIIDKNKSC